MGQEKLVEEHEIVRKCLEALYEFYEEVSSSGYYSGTSDKMSEALQWYKDQKAKEQKEA